MSRSQQSTGTSVMNSDRHIVCRKVSQWICVIIALVGVLGLIGWLFDLEAATRILPSVATMKFNTAMCFILASISLHIAQQHRRSRSNTLTANIVASLLMLLALSTMLQYLAGIDLGIDQLVVIDRVTLPDDFPGRMSIGTALNFAIVATSLLMLDVETSKEHCPAQYFAILAIFISGAALLGYIFGVTEFRLVLFSSMSMITATLFVLFGFAICLARPDSGLMGRLNNEQIGARMARIMLPVFAVVPVVIGYFSFRGRVSGYYSAEFGFALFCLLTIIMLFAVVLAVARILNSAERYFTATFEFAPTAMIVTDLNGLIVRINSLAETAFGYKQHELAGKPIELLIPVSFRHSHPALRKQFVQNPAARRMGKERDLFGLRKDGSEFPVEVALNPIESYNGMNVLSAIVDITQRKNHEIELKERTDDLARSNTDLEQFAYIASHDLQEPLRAVSGSVQLLDNQYKDKLDDKAREFISHAKDGVSRMQTLIEDLLAFSRLSKRDELTKEVDFNSAYDSAIKNLHQLITESGAEVLRSNLPTFPAYYSQVVLLFQNLIGNAIKFRREGVAASVKVDAADLGDSWQFSISDNGIGIDPQYFDRIFLIFQRLHSRKTYSGTGIGLAICKRIVEQHGGKIWLESNLGEGTIIYFAFPKPAET